MFCKNKIMTFITKFLNPCNQAIIIQAKEQMKNGY